MDERFAQALIQAASQRATNLGGSPNQTAGNASQMANLQNLAQLKFQDQGGAGAQAAMAGNAGAVADVNEKRAQNEARIAEINADTDEKLRQIEAAKDDPKNFTREPAEDGGWNFFDGRGNPISAQQYAKARGERLTDALKDSQNPNDQDFLNDYKDTVELGRIMASGDKKQLDKFYKERPELKSYMQDNNVKTFQDYVQRFQRAYPDKFGQQQAEALGNRTVASDMSIGGNRSWLDDFMRRLRGQPTG